MTYSITPICDLAFLLQRFAPVETREFKSCFKPLCQIPVRLNKAPLLGDFSYLALVELVSLMNFQSPFSMGDQ